MTDYTGPLSECVFIKILRAGPGIIEGKQRPDGSMVLTSLHVEESDCAEVLFDACGIAQNDGAWA
jgi:hypothetical protein